MSIVKGSDIQPGQTIKDRGRWWTVNAWVTDDPYWTGPEFRLAECTGTNGKQDRVIVYNDDTYALRVEGKASATVIDVPDSARSDDGPAAVEIRFRKRRLGGWDVVRADNGRLLGWLAPEYDPEDCLKAIGWSAHASSTAFRGDDPGDEGFSLDRVPYYLFNGESAFLSRSLGADYKREDAAQMIIAQLAKNRAPAVGFGRHYAVSRWDDR